MPAGADPTASFSIFDVTVTLGGEQFTLPGQPASWWLTILTEDRLNALDIIPGAFNADDQQRFDQLLLDGVFDMDELRKVTREVITVVSGHPWWWSLGLISILRSDQGTELLGMLTSPNPDQVPLARWLNTLYSRLVRNLKEQDRTKLDLDLDTPPADSGVSPEEVIDEDQATATFFSMMNQPGR